MTFSKKGNRAMNSWRYGMMLFLGLVVLVQGCSQSGSHKATSETDRLQKTVSDLQSQLAQAKQTLSGYEDENKRLAAELQSAGRKEGTAEQKGLERSSEGGMQTKGPENRAGDGEGRIRLMGAKALAEFRAEQLSKRLDKLNKDLDLKEQELVTIRENAETKDEEVANLSRQIKELQDADRTRTSELQGKLDSIGKELAERSTAMDKLKQELGEKTELLNALKSAVTDAAKLKSNAETEVTRLQSELTKAAGQADAAGKQTAQLKHELEQLQNQAVRTREDIDQCREQSEELRAEAESSKQESQKLKAELSELSKKAQVAESAPPAAEEEHPSALDNLLEGKQSAGKSDRPSGLY
jgi:chromosome segregation ATPase